ncbi:MAG: Ig-like domain-containing protein [Isosphaeraceae bacterium]
MRSESSKVETAQSRTRFQIGARQASARKQKARRLMLESLEQRELLAVIPAATVSGQTAPTQLFEPSNSNNSSPSITVDPTNPNNLVAVWQTKYPVPGGTFIGVDGAYSTDGGTNWNAFPGGWDSALPDPTLTAAPFVYTQATDGTVDMDRNGNVYVLVSQHNDANSSGVLLMNKFTLNNGTLTAAFTQKPIYAWTQDQALKPTLAVDRGVKTFTDTYTDAAGNTVTSTQTDAAAGNVYVAWATVDAPPPNVTNWNPNTIKLVGSSDGGVTFSGARTVGLGNFGSQRETSPRIVVSQGTAVVGGGNATVAGGTVNVVWDDFGSGATASPTPYDLLMGRTYTGAVSSSFSNIGPKAINDPASGAPPATTTFPITVNVPANFGTTTDVSVQLAIQHAADAELTVQLQSPGGTTVTLVANNTASGANFGSSFGSNSMLMTNFSQSGNKTVANGTAPYLGTFRPSTGSLAVFNNLTPAQINGTWNVIVTDSTNGNAGILWKATVDFTSNFRQSTTHAIAQTVVRGSLGAGGVVAAASSPQGIGPAPSLASDNTLGGNSPHQGRIYLTYTDRYDPNNGYTGNPADNTDIFLLVSDDGGTTWNSPDPNGFFTGWGYTGKQINDDNSQTDGFSEANSDPLNGNLSGRPQFLPVAQVDQATGTLVIDYYDTRFDAAKSRYATQITASIDGGGSFSKSMFANAPLQAYDQASNKIITLGPIPDNTSSGDNSPGKDTTFYYGDRMGLAVSNGKVYPVWSGNFNGGDDGRQLLQMYFAQGLIAAGPRIVGGTMGPVGEAGDTLNSSRAADGGPQAHSVIVTFDRPVDPNTFTADAAHFQILGRDVNGNAFAIQPTVTQVTPLDNGTYGATQFQVDFTTVLVPGTYSYAVGPNITDRIRQVNAAGTVVTSTGNAMDQNANGSAGEASVDEFAAPGSVNGTPLFAPFVRDQLPLVVPGPHVVSWKVQNEQATSKDHLALNSAVTYIDVTFDRDMQVSSFTPSQVLRIQGPAGLVTGTITVAPIPAGATIARTFRISFPVQKLSGTYTVDLGPGIRSASGYAIDNNLNAGVDALRGTASQTTPLTYTSSGAPVSVAPGQSRQSTITVPDNFIVQGITLQLNITSASDPSLSASLIAPDGTTILLFQNVGTTGTQANFTNTVFDDNATTPISNGGPPFFGRFRPQQALTVLDGSSSITGPGGTGSGVYTLRVTNAATGKATTINGWSITLAKPLPSTGLGEPVADRTPLSFRIFTMDPTNPLASTTWTSMGPAGIGEIDPFTGNLIPNTHSGRIGGLALDPSDASGNTVYVAGASGGVWVTHNFLTTDPNGPTYIPVTDFGPTFGLNIGGIAVFGRNNDPNQSMVFVSTGEGDSGSTGVGVLRSMDGGASWTLLDSTDNTLPFAARDHAFVGSTGFKIIVDPNPTPSGQAIVYMAISGTNGGIWRSLDSGQTWGILDPVTGRRSANISGQATDVVLDPVSGPVNAISNPTGNLQIMYAAIRGQGVYMSPNQGQVWSLMTGGVGDPLIQDPSAFPTPRPITVGNLGVNPNGAKGRIVLAKPDAFPSSDPSAAQKNFMYQGWLYAAVVTPDNHLDGLYVTKDQGQNWTKILLPNLTTAGQVRLDPTNDSTKPSYDVLGNGTFAQGNYDVSLVCDPTNPNVVYLGGTADGNPTGLIRVDISGLSDPHSYYLGMDRPDGGTLYVNSTDAMTLKQNPLPADNWFTFFGPGDFDPRTDPSTAFGAFGVYWGRTVNLVRDPANPMGGNATFYANNVTQFANSGVGAKWIGFDQVLQGSTDQHRVLAFRDPLTGHARLIFGDDQGVFSGVDNGDGTLSTGIGTSVAATGSRNGNLQITQFYYGASQPSSAAAQIAQALLYGQAQDDGFPVSDPNVLTNGNIAWVGPAGDGTGVATDQTGTGTTYRYNWACCGGNTTDFFRVAPNGGVEVGRTNGLIQQSGGRPVPDPQWPFLGGFNFGVNPINGDQVVISSGAGRVFRTLDQGNSWQVIAEPSILDGSNAPALTFGAPDPGATVAGQLGNFIYAGTSRGNIFVTFTGGGGAGNQWYNITNGALAGNTSPVQAIITNPTRGSHEAFAVTGNGVYYISDSNPTAGAVWQNITGNLFSIQQNPFGDASLANTKLAGLTSIVADWRYVIPDNPKVTNGPTHPMLYVGGLGGVYRSTDKGQTWSLFPLLVEPGSLNTTSALNIPGGNGGLPNAQINDLDISIGNVDPTTGRSIAAAGDPNLLLATTFGRGSFGIKLAPVVFANQIKLDTALPAPGGSQNGTAPDGTPLVTVSQPVIDGVSEQTAFGNVVRITLWDYTDPANPRLIGGYDPANPSTDNPANQTDSFGKFAVQVNVGAFSTNGLKTIGIQATDLSGTQGNIALFTFTLKANLSNVNQPPTTPTIGMNPADDSSGGLLITNNKTPRIIGVTDPNVTVQLYLSDNALPNPKPTGAPLATTTSNSLGNYSLTFPNLGDGIYYIQTVATNAFGSSNSSVFKFQIKTNAPTTTPTIGLLGSDDTGIVGDNVTSFRTPHFVGTADPGAKVQLYRVTNGVRGTVLSTVTADPTTGAYSIQLPFALSNGTITLQVGETDVAGNQGPYSSTVPVTIVTTAGDYTNVGKTTPTVFRRSASGNAQWFTNGAPPSGGWTVSGSPQTGTKTFGSSSLDIPFQGDFDGDGVTDTATYRPSTQTWTLARSALGTVSFTITGASVTDIPVSGDFDGDGLTDVGQFNTTSGVWTIAESLNGTTTIPAIAGYKAGDVPVPGNYDNTGKAEPAFYRQSEGKFYIQAPSPKGTYTVSVFTGAGPNSKDIPVPGDYNNSFAVVLGVPVPNRSTEPAVFNPTTGAWAIVGPNGVYTVTPTNFKAGDIPAPGDYTGSGSLQPAYYRPSTSTFYLTSGVSLGGIGLTGDIPTNSPLIYRNLVATPTMALAASSNTGFTTDNVTTGRFDATGNRWLDFAGTSDPNTTIEIVNLNAGGLVVASTTSDATGKYAVSVQVIYNGTYNYAARARNLAGAASAASPTVTVIMTTSDGSFTGSPKANQDIFNRSAGNITWNAAGVTSPTFPRTYGASTLDVPFSADLDADGKTDLLVYRPSTATWYAQRSAFGYSNTVLGTWGWPGVDIPVPADYNGDGMTDIAVYRPSIGSSTDGYWYIAIAGQSGFTYQPIAPAKAGDVPVPGDYDNTGHAELAVFRPTTSATGTAQWIISDPFTAGGSASATTRVVQFGGLGTVPVPGAYDAVSGNRAIQPATWNPTTGVFSIRVSASSTRNIQFKAGDIPAPGDYNGDGITDPVVFRPSTGQWLVAPTGSTTPIVFNSTYGTGTFGTSKDIPLLSPYKYRQVSGGSQIILLGGVTNGAGSGSSSSNGNAAAFDFGSTARNLNSGSTTATPAPAASPTHVNLHAPARHHIRVKPAAAAHHGLVTQSIHSKKPGQLF